MMNLILVGDSLVRHLDTEFCSRNGNRRRLCYPGDKLQDLIHKVQNIVRDTAEDSIAVVEAGSNNMVRAKLEEMVKNYRALIRMLKDSRRKVVVAGLLPRDDVGSDVISRMLCVYTGVEGICKTK